MTLPRGQLQRPPCIATIIKRLALKQTNIPVFIYPSMHCLAVPFCISNLNRSIGENQPSMVRPIPGNIWSKLKTIFNGRFIQCDSQSYQIINTSVSSPPASNSSTFQFSTSVNLFANTAPDDPPPNRKQHSQHQSSAPNNIVGIRCAYLL